MYFAAGERDYEQATIERNRLQAVKSLLERQRVAEGGAGTYDAVAVAVEGTEANAQVFQVRDGVLSDRQSFYLENQAEQEPAIVAEEFMLQYYASALVDPAADRRPGRRWPRAPSSGVLGAAAGRAARRRRSRSARPSAAASAASSTSPSATRGSRSTRRSSSPSAAASSASTSLTGLQQALELDALPVRIECFDISHVGGTHTVASMVVFEGGAPKKSDYRRFTIREVDTGDDFAAMAEVLSRRYAQWEKQAERSPYDAERDASFAALPNLVVIDGGKGQLGAGLEPLQGFRDRGVAVVSLAKRIEEVFLPGQSPTPIVLPHDTPELQLLQRVRDEAHRFAITHHRIRRDKAMTESIMDDLPGHRPGAQARAAQALRLARGGARRLPRGRSRTCPASRRRSPATSTPTSTGRDAEMANAVRDTGRPPAGLQPRGPRGHLRAVRGRQVERDERLRGRGLLLRRQPARGDDPLAQRAVHARGLQGRARGGRLRLARRRVPRRRWRA